MAHEFESGFFARQGAWHGLGTVVAEELTVDAALKTAGLDWNVYVEDTFCADGTKALSRAIRREDTKAILGSVGQNYVPIQNKEAFDFVDEIIGKGLASFHTAGALKGGRRVWILVKLPGDIDIAGDKVEKYLLFAQAHDGTMQAMAMITPIRVVCMNTLNWAVDKAGEKAKARHTKNELMKIQHDVSQLVAEAEGRYEKFEEQATKLSRITITDEQMRKLILTVQPPPKTVEKAEDIPTRTKRIWTRLWDTYKQGPGTELETANGTAWGAVNAVAYYVDHDRTSRGANEIVRGDNRTESVLFGSGAAMKQKAVNRVYELIGEIPETKKPDNGDRVNRILNMVDIG